MREEEAKTKRCPINTPGVLEFQKCKASDCMMWRFMGDGFERIKTNNLTADQKTMIERAKTHPRELAIWQMPEGEPSIPPGDGWERDGDMRQAKGYALGCFEQKWKRRVSLDGYCGLAGKE